MQACEPLFEFSPPADIAATATRNAGAAPPAALRLPYAVMEFVYWGYEQEHFACHQYYQGSSFAVGIINIHVSETTLLTMQCRQVFSGMIYILNGYAFTRQGQNGCLPFLKDTYTLQFYPKGEHPLLLPAGNFELFYVQPGKLLSDLEPEHPELKELAAMAASDVIYGNIASRLALTREQANIIHACAGLPNHNGNTALLLENNINALLRSYHMQTLNPTTTLSAAEISVLVAQQLNEPVASLQHILKKRFYITAPTLLRYWKKTHDLSFRKFAIRIRMMYALYLLVAEHKTVMNVCDQLGYLNISDFGKQFKKVMGFAPSKARFYIIQ